MSSKRDTATRGRSLTKAQRDRMAETLRERQRWLLDGARAKMDNSGDDEGHGDEADIANSALNTDLALDARARESRELQQISNALKKIEDGSYGRCGECNATIGLARLKALPFAVYCIDCQEELENSGAFLDEDGEPRFLDS